MQLGPGIADITYTGVQAAEADGHGWHVTYFHLKELSDNNKGILTSYLMMITGSKSSQSEIIQFSN